MLPLLKSQTVRGIKTRTQNVKATVREFIHVKVDFVLGRDCLLFECYLSSVVPSTKTITGCKSSEVKSQVFHIVPQVVYFVKILCLKYASCFLLYNLRFRHSSMCSEVSNSFHVQCQMSCLIKFLLSISVCILWSWSMYNC